MKKEKSIKEFVMIIFDKYDHNHDGFLTLEDVKHLLRDIAIRQSKKLSLGELEL